MTYSQQRPQQPGKPNRLALWVNNYKSAPNHPDYKGHVEISYELAQELMAAFNAGSYTQDYAGRAVVKLDVGIYAQQSDGRKPVMSGTVSTVAETAYGAAMREQTKARNGIVQTGMAPQYAPQQPAQPQYVQAPAAPPAAPPAPPPAPQPMPQAAVPVAPPMANAIHGQPPAAPAAAPQLPPNF